MSRKPIVVSAISTYGVIAERAAIAPLPLVGRGRGWGERLGRTVAMKVAHGLRGFTPPLAPPHQEKGNSGVLVVEVESQ
jgi:hypothetical protein